MRDLATGLGHHLEDAVHGTRYRIEDARDWLVSRHLPDLEPVPATAVAGLVVGAVSVVAGWGLRLILSSDLGTVADGSLGLVAFGFLSLVAFMVGERVLAGLGVLDARVVSAFSVLLVQSLLLVSSVEFVAVGWAWLVVPACTPLAFVAIGAVVRAAERELA